jgi:hypothetical protein
MDKMDIRIKDDRDNEDLIISARPDRNCPRCRGRGFIGQRGKGQVLVCTCVMQKKERIKEQGREAKGKTNAR